MLFFKWRKQCAWSSAAMKPTPFHVKGMTGPIGREREREETFQFGKLVVMGWQREKANEQVDLYPFPHLWGSSSPSPRETKWGHIFWPIDSPEDSLLPDRTYHTLLVVAAAYADLNTNFQIQNEIFWVTQRLHYIKVHKQHPQCLGDSDCPNPVFFETAVPDVFFWDFDMCVSSSHELVKKCIFSWFWLKSFNSNSHPCLATTLQAVPPDLPPHKLHAVFFLPAVSVVFTLVLFPNTAGDLIRKWSKEASTHLQEKKGFVF